ncbi:MAG: RNA polymerase sigma-54 factor [Planctomycetota bacterium]|jgi:RNA polymerase sigma-54 factor
MSSSNFQPGLQLRAEQQMLLQPRLLQSIEILQIPAQDLEGWLNEAAESNEALRVEVPTRTQDGPRQSWDATDRHDEMLRNHPDRDQGLAESLGEQIGLLDLDPEVRRWVQFLVSCLDESGYLSQSDEELIVLAGKAGLEVDYVSLGLAIAALQKVEPRGIGGRNMVEALLLQLDEGGSDYASLCRLIEEFLDDMVANRLPSIARELGIEIEELGTLMGQLRGLNPKPGAELCATQTPVLRPDLMIEREPDGSWALRLERSNLPTVSIDSEIVELSKDKNNTTNVRKWAREKVERATWVVDAVAQRGATLLRVANEVFDRQRAFLEEGPGHLVAFRMGEIADVLELHVSTISRAVSGKYVQTPWGILPLRHFFQVATGSGSAPARDDLSAIVRSIFEGEDSSEPLSDDAVAEELARRGHQVARRTVAKHRRQLGIASSYRRRKFS